MWSVLGFLIVFNEMNHCSLLQLMWSSSWSAKGKNHGRWCLGLLFPFIQKSLHQSMYFLVCFRYQKLMEKQTKKGCSQSEQKKQQAGGWKPSYNSVATCSPNVARKLGQYLTFQLLFAITHTSAYLPALFLFRNKGVFHRLPDCLDYVRGNDLPKTVLWVTATAAVLGNGADTSGTAHLRPNVSYTISNIATQLLPSFF